MTIREGQTKCNRIIVRRAADGRLAGRARCIFQGLSRAALDARASSWERGVVAIFDRVCSIN